VALPIHPPFKKLCFVNLDEDKVDQLQGLFAIHPTAHVFQGDCVLAVAHLFLLTRLVVRPPQRRLNIASERVPEEKIAILARHNTWGLDPCYRANVEPGVTSWKFSVKRKQHHAGDCDASFTRSRS
jgi:hypothetical protein